MRIQLAMLVLVACTNSRQPEPVESRPVSPVVTADAGWLPANGDPPPDGVVVPAVGRVIEAKRGAADAAYQWRAIVEIDPEHPEIVAIVKASQVSPGQAGADAYALQVKNAGVGRGGDTYYIQNQALQVNIIGSSDRDDTDARFEILVAIPGG